MTVLFEPRSAATWHMHSHTTAFLQHVTSIPPPPPSVPSDLVGQTCTLSHGHRGLPDQSVGPLRIHVGALAPKASSDLRGKPRAGQVWLFEVPCSASAGPRGSLEDPGVRQLVWGPHKQPGDFQMGDNQTNWWAISLLTREHLTRTKVTTVDGGNTSLPGICPEGVFSCCDLTPGTPCRTPSYARHSHWL